jgi:hypothetical protein
MKFLDRWLKPKTQKPMRAISFSLYGDDPKYINGMVANINLRDRIYKGWQIYIYCDGPAFRNIGGPIGEYEYHSTGVTLYRIAEKIEDHPIPPMFWRFMIADNPLIERFIVRDADSRLSEREAAAVEEWIKSDKILHIMRDHQAHQLIPGGMWGAQWRRDNWAAPEMSKLIAEFVGTDHANEEQRKYGADQEFLRTKVWPWAKNSVIQHDASEHRRKQLGGVPFPTKREWPRFVGEVFNEHDEPRANDWPMVPKEE